MERISIGSFSTEGFGLGGDMGVIFSKRVGELGPDLSQKIETFVETKTKNFRKILEKLLINCRMIAEGPPNGPRTTPERLPNDSRTIPERPQTTPERPHRPGISCKLLRRSIKAMCIQMLLLMLKTTVGFSPVHMGGSHHSNYSASS